MGKTADLKLSYVPTSNSLKKVRQYMKGFVQDCYHRNDFNATYSNDMLSVFVSDGEDNKEYIFDHVPLTIPKALENVQKCCDNFLKEKEAQARNA